MLKHFTKYLRESTLELKYLRSIIKKQDTIISSKKTYPNLNIQSCRYLHLDTIKNTKLFVESENAYAYKIVQSLPIEANILDVKIQSVEDIFDDERFNSLVNKNWRSETASNITKAFLNVRKYCQQNNINISDKRFDKLVDVLLDNVEKLTTNELYSVLECLTELPPVDSYDSHNYHDIWSALDDICCWKMKDWNLETLFKFANLWRNLNLGRIGDYIFKFIDKMSKNPSKLTQQELVHAFFYMNVCRKRPINFEWEDAVERKVQSLTLDELAIIAMGFFKTQTKIKLSSILNKMLQLVTENADNIHEISLAAILKIVRMSQHPQTADNIVKMLDKIAPEIPRLSHLASIHVALTGTSLQILHKPTLKAVAQKIVNNVSDIEIVRLKDIERMLLATSMFDFDPKTTPDFYETLCKELTRDERIPEKVRHPKCVPCALVFLSAKNIYSEQLMNEVLDPEFTKEVYGKNSRLLPRELYFLNISSEIDFPEYQGKKWTLEMKQKACKWLRDTLPDRSKRSLSAADKLYFSVIDTLNTITGDSKYLYIEHVLPQYAKPDIILCIDRATNAFVEPINVKNNSLGEIIRPIDLEKYKWYAILIVSFNLSVRYTFEPVSNVNMKKRHLEAIGYEPVLVKWNEYNWLAEEERIDYMLNKIKRL